MTSLEERLKRIRGNASTSRALNPPPKPQPTEDEVHALLQQTIDENAADKSQSGAGVVAADDDNDDLEAWLGQDSGSEDEGAVIRRGDLREISKEADDLTRAAEEALAGLHRDGTLAASAALLQVEPKEKPVLSRTSSEKHSSPKATGADSLEDDLADAMADELGSGNERDKPSQDSTTPEKFREVDDLSLRLAQLRADHRSIPKQPQVSVQINDHDNEEASFSLDLPSAPKTQPAPMKEDVNWKEKHGIEGRELSSYEKLVRLNATSLGAPSSMPRPGVPKKAEEERDETEEWCCICNEDATLSCMGCDGDLYCGKCWKDVHDDMYRDELLEHITKMFSGHRRKQLPA
jgi:hypothetical protein